MQTWKHIAMTLMAAGAVWACSGGTDTGPISGPGPSRDEGPEGKKGNNDNPFQTSGQSTGSGSCLTCQDVLNGAVEGQMCSGSDTLLAVLGGCAMSNCPVECGSGLNSDCQLCLQVACSVEYGDCANDFQ